MTMEKNTCTNIKWKCIHGRGHGYFLCKDAFFPDAGGAVRFALRRYINLILIYIYNK